MKPRKVFYVFLLWLKSVFKTIVTNATKIKVNQQTMKIEKEREKRREGSLGENEYMYMYD